MQQAARKPPAAHLRAEEARAPSHAPLVEQSRDVGARLLVGGSLVAAAGVGPQAAHSRTRFLPDHDFHESEIARIYEESGRRITYLGDWHTHPQGSGHLSHRDLKTLASIAADSRARAPIPLMTILAGLKWSLFVWKGELVQRRFARAKLVVEPVRFAQIGPARSPQSV
jgi:integrative and conjugative element protein (TIGR02256 family)